MTACPTLARLCLLASVCLAATPSFASDHGGGAPAAAPIKFITNLGNRKYVQFDMVLEVAAPDAELELNARRPVLQHRILLMLSDESVESLTPIQGKLKLQEKIQEIANKLIGETPKSGVKEVLFTSFIIQ